MDGLSAAASITGILSITIQLAGGIKRLHDFFSEVNDAPQEIRETVQELRLLGSFLERLQEHEKRQPLDPIAVAVLQNCNNKVTGLLNFIAQWEPAYTSRKHRVRTWNSFKATLQRDRLDKLKLSLEETKTSLILIRQDLSERLQYTLKDEVLTAISHGFAKLEFQRTTKTTTTETEGAGISKDHVSDLRSEIRHLTRTMSVPWISSGLQADVEDALQELDSNLQRQAPPPPGNATGPIGLASTLPEKASSVVESVNGGHSDIDLEKGLDFHVPQPRPVMTRHPRRTLVSNTVTIKNTPFGVIYIYSKRFVTENNQRSSLLGSERPPTEEIKTSFKFHPARWLMSWNLNLGAELLIARGSRGWKTDICTVRAVSNDHPVFEFCRTGNITGVKASLSTGTASPWDTNPHGWTPLHLMSVILSSASFY
ncbi:hypothetical protein F4821DRAFT_177737 [Hypoxylon rubiginosum]|uniref:Uncharacterized protein n=1 Tax=Hypoxylon rubiginosum TaxID=110542 RepID=A0ACC0CUK5_9PEZI|nr:hypothetical protein F4821DRAFT_177737 [Hypoxylon rubiginosum]